MSSPITRPHPADPDGSHDSRYYTKTEVDTAIAGATGAVDSVNGQTGAVALTQDNVPDGVAAKQYPAADKTKLAGVASGATANQTDAYLLSRANHTGTQSADTLIDGTANKAYTAAEKTKLAGIAAGAEVNVNADWNASSGDAQILNKPSIPAPFASPLTTKGDLYGRGASADSRVPVGADGQVLVVDSAQAAGLGYAYRRRTIPLVPGNYYTVQTHGTGFRDVGNPTAAANLLSLVFLELPAPINATSLQINVKTATASGNAQLGLFAYNFATGVATLLRDGGSVSTATTGNKTVTFASTPLLADWIAIGILPDTTVTLMGGNCLFGFGQGDIAGNPLAGRSVAATYGAFSSSYTTTGNLTGWTPNAGVK